MGDRNHCMDICFGEVQTKRLPGTAELLGKPRVMVALLQGSGTVTTSTPSTICLLSSLWWRRTHLWDSKSCFDFISLLIFHGVLGNCSGWYRNALVKWKDDIPNCAKELWATAGSDSPHPHPSPQPGWTCRRVWFLSPTICSWLQNKPHRGGSSEEI